MALNAGTRLGRYEILSAIGAGGMGEVYRARDAQLQRDIAIKVLPENLALDPEQRARFEREAQAIAALSHPNILSVFDTGIHDGRLYVVTELLEGQTLRDRLSQGPLPVRKAVDWAMQIARGLAAAHDKHLVHRDLKPENIFLVADGRAKILDFGLARSVAPASDRAETVGALTGAGVVLGTVGYMAPEQVRGGDVDPRTDLFAFGTVLFEMLTGQRAFRRNTAAETMTAILNEEPPDLLRQRTDLPPALERIVNHCLEKAPHDRFQSAGDVAFALDALSSSSTEATRPAAVADAERSGSGRARWLVAGIAAVAVVGLGWVGYSQWAGSPAGGADAGLITIGAATQVTTDDGLEIDPALSPDGKLLAYAGGQAARTRIFIRPVAGGRTLTLSESGSAIEYGPRWSPDGNQILFMARDGAFVASSLGGAVTRVASGTLSGAAWAPDGRRILLARGVDLAIRQSDGVEQPLATYTAGLDSCSWSPRDEWIACAAGNTAAVIPGNTFGNVAPSEIVIVRPGGGAFSVVSDRTSANTSPTWAPDGRHLYFVSNKEGPRDLYAVTVTIDGASGDATRITTGLNVQSISLSAAGDRLAYVVHTSRANLWSLPIPALGTVDTSKAEALTSGSQVIEAMRVSPDRKWLMYDSTQHLNADVFRIPIGGGAPERLTTDAANEFAPDLSPDGREVAFHSFKSGTRDIYVKPLDGGPIQALTSTPGQESYPHWSPDGEMICYVDQSAFEGKAIPGVLYVLRRDAAGRWSAPVEVHEGVYARSAWLPGGKEIAFSNGSGIEVVSVNGGTARTVYAPSPGGSDPPARAVALSDDGRTFYFKGSDEQDRSTIWSIPVTGGKPRLLVRFVDPAKTSVRPDFAAGNGRFYFTLEDRQADIWLASVVKKQ
jgi:Tol biopolymer transport system component